MWVRVLQERLFFGLVTEWFNVLVLKTKGFLARGFESHLALFWLVSLMVEHLAVNHVMRVRFLHRPFFPVA